MVASSTSAAPRRRRTGAALLVVAVTATLMLLLTSEGAAATAAKTKNKQLPRRRGGGGGVSSSPIFTKLSTSLSGSAAASKKKIENLEGGSQEGSMPRALAIYSTGCERERSNWAGAIRNSLFFTRAFSHFHPNSLSFRARTQVRHPEDRRPLGRLGEEGRQGPGQDQALNW